MNCRFSPFLVTLRVMEVPSKCPIISCHNKDPALTSRNGTATEGYMEKSDSGSAERRFTGKKG